jgi:hypothetical protein
MRRTRGPVIAVGRSQKPPELVVSVCSAFVLKMLYTSLLEGFALHAADEFLAG